MQWALALVAGVSASGALPELLQVDWRRIDDPPAQGPYQQGFQDSDGGWVDDNTVLTAFGYSAGGVPGFLNTAYLFNATNASAGWVSLPRAPVSGRQEVGSTVIGDCVYFVGGFSYSAPYAYTDALRLCRTAHGNGTWAWSALPPLPYPLCSHGVASIGTKLYVHGGADYDAQAFYTFADRHGENAGLGKRLFVLDTTDLAAGWARLPDTPGSPRYVHALSPAGRALYVLGGAVPNGSSVVDNWRYDTEGRTWTRLADLPVSSGNFQTNGASSYLDRYVLLVGGYQYGSVYRFPGDPRSPAPNASSTPPFGQARRMCPTGVAAAGCRSGCAASATIVDKHYMGSTWATEYENDIFVYDTERDVFGTVRAVSSAEPGLMPPRCGGLPINDNLPQTNVRGDQVFVIGGEANDRQFAGRNYTHYPRLAVVGKLSVVQ